MPLALEQMDLRGYDLIISSESGPAKGIVAPVDALHVCYCHSPMRYIWNMFHDYRERSGAFTKLVMRPVPLYPHMGCRIVGPRAPFYRQFGQCEPSHPGYYRRDADVIYPPVETSAFQIARPSEVQISISWLASSWL